MSDDDATPSAQRSWRINPQTLGFDPEQGEHPGTFTAQEWREQQWPRCPVCDTTVDVAQVDVQTSGDHFPVYLMGRWQCPNNCDPRGVLGHLSCVKE